jgi:hypothetical protein
MVVVVLSFSEGRASRVVRLWRDDLINDLIDRDDPSPRAYVRRENDRIAEGRIKSLSILGVCEVRQNVLSLGIVR